MIRSTRTSSKLLSLLFVLALLVTACGTDDGDDGADADPDTEDAGDDGDGEDSGDSDDDGASGASFYDGKTLKVVVPHGPGGGADTSARLVAKHLMNHIDGLTVQVVNEDGGAGVVGVNHWVNQEPHDGTVALLLANNPVVSWLLGDPGVQYDLTTDFHPVWANPGGRVSWSNPASGVETATDLGDESLEIVHGFTSPTSVDFTTIIALDALGVRDNIEEVWGYESNGAMSASVEGGELDVMAGSTTSYLSLAADLVEQGDLNALYSFGLPTRDGLERDPAAPDVPTIEEVYEEMHGEAPSGTEWDVFTAYNNLFTAGAVRLMMHPDAPEEAIQELTDAIMAMAEDQAYLDEAAETLGPYEPIVGEDLEDLLEAQRGMSEDVLEHVRAILRDEHDLDV